MVRLTIEGKKVSALPNQTILEVARQHGFAIPTLCYHEALEPFGACRLCVVEVKTSKGWNLVTSCTYPVTDGLVVRINSDSILRSRRMTVELMMATSAHLPIVQELASEYGVGAPRFTMASSDCILCGLCVRACKEIVGVGAISVVNRGISKRISPPFEIASHICIECGTCVLICPTGAISFEDITGRASSVHELSSEFYDRRCRLCGQSKVEPVFVDHEALLAEAEQTAQAEVKEVQR
jgi:NADH dehydrogenase/NADH:ubiquinone oxidoreductase subunit G